MKNKLNHISLALAMLALSALNSQLSTAHAQGTAFTYQGQLDNGTNPVTGTYDVTFKLYNAASGGSQVGSTITNVVGITNGIFTVTADFGSVYDGTTYWLQLGVRTNGGGSFTALSPRQELTPTPYSVSAENLLGSLPVTDLSGTLTLAQLPSSVVTENESGVTLDNLVIGGTLNLPVPASILINGTRLIYADDNENLFAGIDAGNTSLTGFYNTGIGGQALLYTGVGSYNSVIGFDAMFDNQTGSFNTANGAFALEYNTTGSNNTATGAYALSAVDVPAFVIGGGNTADGAYALAGDEGGYNNTAVGYSAMSAGTNGFDNVAVGVDALQELTDPSANFLNTAVGAYSLPYLAAGYYNTVIGAYALYSLTNGSFNMGLGLDAGYYLESGSDNIYIGNYGNQGDNDVTRIGEGQNETFISSWNGWFDNGVLSLQQGDTNNGLAYQSASPLPNINFGQGPFLYGYDGGSIGTVAPLGINLSWDYTGDVWISNNLSTASLTIRGGSDLAEPFKITSNKDELPDGSVVVIDEANTGHLKESSQPYDTRVAGILSGANGVHPGIQMQQQGLLEGDRNVALTGRVYVQADTSNGAIRPGDLLTTSSAPGRAMKVTDHLRAQGAILGKAMSGLSEGNGMVLVLVTLQ
jgi:hypothetical protein